MYGLVATLTEMTDLRSSTFVNPRMPKAQSAVARQVGQDCLHVGRQNRTLPCPALALPLALCGSTATTTQTSGWVPMEEGGFWGWPWWEDLFLKEAASYKNSPSYK